MIGDGNFISQVPLFGGLDDAQQVSLQQKMGHTTLRRGETLFDEGDLGDRLYIVTEGKVKLGHTSSDGVSSASVLLSTTRSSKGLSFIIIIASYMMLCCASFLVVSTHCR